ncbi:MAG: TnpV protein [Clostridia bacterium]
MRKKRKEVLKMDMTYTMKNNYLIPDLIIEKTTNQKTKLGKFAQMRLAYLKQNKRGTYTMLIGSNQLTAHLMTIQKVATERIEQMIEKMKEKYGITEEMKAKDQMEWVGQMNNIRATVEQIVIREIIYS